MPTPQLPGGPLGNGPVSAPADPLDGAHLAAEAAAPVRPRAARVWPSDRAALASTGPHRSGSDAHASGPAARLPRQNTPAGAPSPAYGDWTKPSRSSRPVEPDLATDFSDQVGLWAPVAPATTAIPERAVDRWERPVEVDGLDGAAFDAPLSDAPPSDEFPARGATSGPGTGPVGGRAAVRAQRQAVDMARRKAAKRSGAPVGVPDDEDATGRRPRRVLLGLLAVVVVALGVLGVYTVVAPEPEEAASAGTPTQSSAPSEPGQTAVLPPLETGAFEVEVDAAPATPVLAPVTVLNATEVNGMAAQVAAVLEAGGWQTPGVGTYLADDIATSTVFYAEGDETQRQAAESLKAQFPQLQTTAPRFFEVPADVAAPGLVVVLTAEWQP